jgi:glycosyltransferase involved in cell wall biosynthesis
MVHDHDLVCLRRHKYFPLTGKICERAAGRSCYTSMCFIQRPTAESRLPVAIRTLSEQRAAFAHGSNVSRFIVGSRWMKQQLEVNGLSAGDIDIVHPIPSVLDRTTALEPSPSNEILYVGQIVRGKGVDLLLRALARLEQPWRARIVGDGNHLPACRELAAQLGIADRVVFTGWVDHEELERFYANALFSVVPSRWPEPFGMVGPEAMARARAVVGFAAGGIPDWLDDGVTGLLASPGDVQALGHAMDSLLADPQRAHSLGRRGRHKVLTHFTHRRYLESLVATLEKVH